MNADTKQNYTIDEVALQKAGIDPRTCYESVQLLARTRRYWVCGLFVVAYLF